MDTPRNGAADVHWVDVGEEPELPSLCGPLRRQLALERLVHEFGTQVGAAWMRASGRGVRAESSTYV